MLCDCIPCGIFSVHKECRNLKTVGQILPDGKTASLHNIGCADRRLLTFCCRWSKIPLVRRCGEIGIRMRLKISGSQERAGSTPAIGTITAQQF